jgi:drug/metabolite transporter (DMT)-like permease
MASVGQPVPPAGLSVVRWLLAALILAPFGWRSFVADWPAMRAKPASMLFLGLVGGAGFSVLQYYALRYTSAINVGVMNSVCPALIILAGVLIFRDKVWPAQLGGIAISLAGVLVILMRGDLAVLGRLAFSFGDIIALANMAIFAIYSACLRTRPQISGYSFLIAMSLIAAAGSLPAAIIETMAGDVLTPAWPTLVAVIYTAVFSSVLAYLAWNAGVAALGAQRAGAFLHLVPLFGAILSMLLLGEEPRLFHAMGLALIVIGVTLAARRPAPVASSSAT